VRAVVDVERGEHGHVGDPHPGDVPGVAGAVVAPVLITDGRGGECHRADDEQVVVLPPAQRGQDRRGGEDDGNRPVVPASGPDVARAALSGQRGDRPGGHGSEPGEHVNG